MHHLRRHHLQRQLLAATTLRRERRRLQRAISEPARAHAVLHRRVLRRVPLQEHPRHVVPDQPALCPQPRHRPGRIATDHPRSSRATLTLRRSPDPERARSVSPAFMKSLERRAVVLPELLRIREWIRDGRDRGSPRPPWLSLPDSSSMSSWPPTTPLVTSTPPAPGYSTSFPTSPSSQI